MPARPPSEEAASAAGGAAVCVERPAGDDVAEPPDRRTHSFADVVARRVEEISARAAKPGSSAGKA